MHGGGRRCGSRDTTALEWRLLFLFSSFVSGSDAGTGNALGAGTQGAANADGV